MTQHTTRRILIVDDHRIIRQGLRMLLADRPDLQVAGEAHDGLQAVTLAAELSPDVVLMDINLPGLDGIEATRQILAASAAAHGDAAADDTYAAATAPRIIALSAYADRRSAAAMLHAGAAGYVLKTSSVDELIGAVDAVTAGRVYLSPSVASVVVDELLQARTGAGPSRLSPAARLSDRERQVLTLIARGLATKEVARDLNVSIKTVETHRRNLMEKLDRHSVAELTHFAISEGLVPLDDAPAQSPDSAAHTMSPTT
jgi:DNA-binding NarL/FixJ family response regulator